MRKPDPGLEDRRCAEILDACQALYAEKGYNAVSIKDISTVTTFSRPSIYNYFRTKEEIFLGLLTREYRLWTQDILAISATYDVLSPEALASHLARTLEKRNNLLKISTMNLYEIEENSSLERLKAFKLAFKAAVEATVDCVDQFLGPSPETWDLVQYTFFPFLLGIYPYTAPTPKQLAAMDAVGVSYRSVSVYQITCQFLTRLFQQRVQTLPEKG